MFGDSCILLCVHVFGVYMRPKKWSMLIFNGGSLIHIFFASCMHAARVQDSTPVARLVGLVQTGHMSKLGVLTAR